MRQFYRSFSISRSSNASIKHGTGISASIRSEEVSLEGKDNVNVENVKDMKGNVQEFNGRAWGLEASIDETIIGSINKVGNGFFVLGTKTIVGDVVTIPGTILSWKRDQNNDILNPERFTLLGLIEPKFDLIVVGTGKNTLLPTPEQRNEIRKIVRNTPVEFMSSFHAAATYNMLSKEGRKIAACLVSLPTKP